MGRKMLRMERIANEKTRLTTYKKRKSCLLKKAKEFSTLCGVDTCVIIYGPNRATVAADPETWPADKNKVFDIISRYKDAASSSCRKTFQIHDFMGEIGNNMERQIPTSKRVKNYCSWDEKLGQCSQEELCRILGNVEDKINKAQRVFHVLEETERRNRALADITRSANHHNFNGYSHIEQHEPQLLNWSHLGQVEYPMPYSHDTMAMEPATALMMLTGHDGYGPIPGFYNSTEGQYGSVMQPYWHQENFVFHDSQVNKWVDPSKNPM